MSLRSSLQKLQQKANRALLCDWCLATLVSPAYSISGVSNNPDLIPRICPFCGNHYLQNLKGMSPHMREAWLMSRDRFDGAMYRDERVYAAERWTGLFYRIQQLLRDAKKPEHHALYGRRHQQKKKVPPDKAARQRVWERGLKLYRKATRREGEIFGPLNHPLHARLELMEYEHISEFDKSADYFEKRSNAELTLRTELKYRQMMAECEKVLWGGALPETQQRVEEIESGVELCVRERVAAHERKQEEKRRREEERQKETDKALARQREAHQATTRVVGVPVPQPDRPVPRDFEAEQNAERIAMIDRVVPEPEVDEKGRKRIEIPYIQEDNSEQSFRYCPGCTSTAHSHAPKYDGSDPYYMRRLAYYKQSGRWLTNEQLQRGY